MLFRHSQVTRQCGREVRHSMDQGRPGASIAKKTLYSEALGARPTTQIKIRSIYFEYLT